MKKLFKYLLKKYTTTEKERLEVFNTLHDKVSSEYSEQTVFGNIYNANIEFLMANDTLNNAVKRNDLATIDMIKRGLANSYDNAIQYLQSNHKINPNLTPEEIETDKIAEHIQNECHTTVEYILRNANATTTYEDATTVFIFHKLAQLQHQLNQLNATK